MSHLLQQSSNRKKNKHVSLLVSKMSPQLTLKFMTIMLCMITQAVITSYMTSLLHVLAGCRTIANLDWSTANARSISFRQASCC